MSACEHFLGPFNFDPTPLGPIGFPVIIHTKPNIRKTWDFRGRKGFNTGPAPQHYCCFHVVDGATKALLFSETVEFLHEYLNQPMVTEGNRIVHVINFLSCAVKYDPATIHHEQLTAISKLRDLFNNWIPKASMKPTPPFPAPPTIKAPAPPAPTEKCVAPASSIRDGTRHRSIDIAPMPDTFQHFWLDTERSCKGTTPITAKGMAPRVVPIEVVDDEPVAHCTRYRISSISASGRTFPPEFIEQWEASEVLHGNHWEPIALSVLDTETGEPIEHRVLFRQPCLAKTWNTSYSNKLGRLCQGIGTDPKDPTKKRVKGTNTFYVIRYEYINLDCRKVIDFSKVVCNFCPKKSDPNRTRITIAGHNISYPGNVGTKTASLDLIEILLNSSLYRKGAKFVTFNIKNFYLQTPLD